MYIYIYYLYRNPAGLLAAHGPPSRVPKDWTSRVILMLVELWISGLRPIMFQLAGFFCNLEESPDRQRLVEGFGCVVGTGFFTHCKRFEI